MNEHEQFFEIHPVGVKYICEFCNEGEMILVPDECLNLCKPPLMKHRCNKCGGELMLPKVYPYVQWIDKDSIPI